jgi:glucuronoarabinoxylan endo-1,4-beta-xylanase
MQRPWLMSAIVVFGFVAACGGPPGEGSESFDSAQAALTGGYVGCYTDSSTRALPTQLASSGATVEGCIAAAQAKGLAYAGVQYGGECWAGNTVGYTVVDDAECNMKCTANASEICGGFWRASVYATSASTPTPPTSSVSVSVAPASASVPAGGTNQFTCTVTGTSNTSCSWTVKEGAAGGGVSSTGKYTAPSTPGTYHVVATSQADSTKSASAVVTVTAPVSGGYVGCYTDSSTRALPTQLATSGATVESCVAAAQAKGLAYAGVQYGGECWAGNTLGYTLVGDADCNMKCTANASEICGGSWRASIYATSASTPTPPPPSPSVSVSVTPASASVPAGGTNQFTCTVTGSSNTSCVWTVKEGAAGGGVSSTGSYTAPSTAGTYHVVATSQADSTKSASAVVTVTAPVSGGYVGCYTDSTTRALPTQLASSGATVESCVAAAQAKGLAYASLQYGGECWAGNTLGYTLVGDGECNMTCTANESEVCGGLWRASVYSTSSSPPAATPPPPSPSVSVSVSVTPASTSVPAGGKKQFTCAVSGCANTSCVWTVKEGAAGGGVSSTGEYTAPSVAGTFNVVATSQADSTKSASAAVTVTAPTGSQDVVVSWSDVHQTMDGFGAADIWGHPSLNASSADFFFSATNGIGLSFLRTGITTGGGTLSSWSNAKLAIARGARVWAVPWSAAASYKDNGSTTNGGHLCAAAGQGSCNGSHYNDWASSLDGYVTAFKSNVGSDLYAISIQNEPDYTASYDSMLYTNQEFVNFIKVLGPKLAAHGVKPKLIVGDYSCWGNIWGLASAIQADAAAASYVDIYAVHQYCGLSAYQSVSHPLWETEVSDFGGFDSSMGNGVGVAKWIEDSVTTGNATSWHYWWLTHDGDNQGLIGDSGALTKRVYAMGNFSRWIRPGWVRVGTSGGKSGLYGVSAYKNPSTGDFAIVVINDSGGPVTATFGLSGATATTVAPWVTTDTAVGNIGTDGNLSLGSTSKGVPSSISLSSGAFTATVPYGVTTFVGKSQ